MHATLYELSYYEDDHASCHICSRSPRGSVVVKRDLEDILDQNLIHITRDRDEYEHEINVIVPCFNLPKLVVIAYNGQRSVVSPLVICLASHTPYEFDKVVPYKYSATMVEDGKEVHIPSFLSVVNISDVSGMTRSGRVFAVAAPKRIEDVVIGKPTQDKTHVMQSGQSNSVDQNSD